ncbi:hypothetical protein D3C74_283970 [compost metagenome]
MLSLRKFLQKLFEHNKRLAIYTAVSGEYDKLKRPIFINNNCDYICFTDNENIKSDFWQIRKMEKSDLDTVRKARRYKILPHLYLPEYEYSLWVDGNYEIIGDVEDFIKKYARQYPMMCLIHPDRDCVYDEAKACIELNRDKSEVISKQMDKYVSENYPENNGMIASGILFRKHNNHQVIKVASDWWREVENHSRRDQLSFNYVCWKNDFNYDTCHLSCYGNEYFKREEHSIDIYIVAPAPNRVLV